MSMLFKRIKDWAVSITSFRIGDVIPVDGPSGTAKMPYSDLAKEVIKDSANNTVATESDLVAGSTLPIMTANGPKALPGNTIAKASEQAALTTYAQNVAHSIASEFDPTKPNDEGGFAYYAGTPVMYNGSCYVFTSNKTSGAWDFSVVEKKPLSEAIQLEGVGEAVNEWLNEHPEATTTVQDGSLTEAKFSDALNLKTIKDYVTPEMFGAKGDGVNDDTSALQEAIDSGKAVVLGKGKNYLVSQIIVKTKTILLGIESRVKCSSESGSFIIKDPSVEPNLVGKVTIKGIHFFVNSRAENNSLICFDFGSSTSFFIIEDVVIENFNKAFYSSHLFWFNVLRNIRLINCNSGFVGEGSINISNLFDTCYFAARYGYCVDLTTFKMNDFVNCAFQSTYGPWAIFRGNCDGLHFENCNFEYCRLNEDETCIQVEDTSNIVFETCYFHDGNRKDNAYSNTSFMEVNGTARVKFEDCWIFGNLINKYFRTSNNDNEKNVVFNYATLSRMINAFSVRSGDTSIIFSLSDVIKTNSRPNLPNEFNGALWYWPAQSKLYFYLNGVYQNIDSNLRSDVEANIYKCRQYAQPVSAKWRKVLVSYNSYNTPEESPVTADNITYQSEIEYNIYSHTLRAPHLREGSKNLEDKYMQNPSVVPTTGTYTLKIVDGVISWVQDAS